MKVTTDAVRALDNELDRRLTNLVDHGTIVLDVPEDRVARLTLFRRVRARGDALYGPTGYHTALNGPRLIIHKAAAE